MTSPFSAIVRFASPWSILPILLLLLCAIALRPEPARADNADAASTAVDLFVKAGQTAGLPVTDQEAEIVKQIVTCGLNKTDVGDCVRNMAVATALKQIGTGDDVAKAATCLLGGTKATTCLSNTLLAQLPVEAQPMVSCMVEGKGNVADCTKKFAEGMIIDKVPADFQPVAKCMIESGDAKKCGGDFVVQQVTSRLPDDIKNQATNIVNCLGGSASKAANCVASAAVPDQIKPLVTCATQPNANVGQCMSNFAAQNLPSNTPGVAKDMIECVGSGDFGKCAQQKGISNAQDIAASQLSKGQQEAIQKALDMIDRLRPDSPMTIEARSGNPATVKNILTVAEGIRDKDWSKVVVGAGPELIIIAGNILLSIFITPALASVLAPAVEAMIHNDAAAAQLALEAIKKGDAVELAKVVFTWYETAFIDKPCALMGDNDVRNTICGGLSDAIKFIADTGGDLAKDLLGAGKDVLQWLGVWGTVDDAATFAFNTLKDAVETVGHFLGIGGDDDEWKPPQDCSAPPPLRESPKDYFANHYLACLPKAAGLAANGANVDTTRLNGACNDYFNRCTDPKQRGSVANACNAMSNSLTNLAGQVNEGMKVAAQAYTDLGVGLASVASEAYKNWESGNLDDLCDPNFWQNNENYINKCSAFVNGRFPVARQSTVVCAIPTPRSDAVREVCIASLRNASAERKDSLAGPNSDYCKKQIEWSKTHPCEKEETGKKIPIPGGGDLPDIRIKCRDLTPLQPAPPWAKLPPINLTLPAPPQQKQKKTIPGLGKSPAQEQLGCGPKGCGGYNTVNGKTNEDEPKKAKKLGSRLPASATLPDKSPNTRNTVSAPPKRPSAMDIIGDLNTDNSLGSVAGTNVGGPATRRAPPIAARPPASSSPGKSGGSGGIGLVNGASGNAPVSSKASTSPSSGNSGSTTSKGGWNPADGAIDYGGCSSCNSKKDPLVVR